MLAGEADAKKLIGPISPNQETWLAWSQVIEVDFTTGHIVDNIRGDEVDGGIHTCSICGDLHSAYFMRYTRPPKLCLACYYDL